jgi:hypothetical protein
VLLRGLALVLPLFLVFLFPLAVYLLVLASINRRDRPLLVAGIWDAIALSFALSGVLLWVGPAILGTIYERGLVPGTSDQPHRRFEDIWTLYPFVWVTYYLLVLAGQAMMIVGRVKKTSVYNVDGPALERLLVDCLRQRGFEVSASGGLIFFETRATSVVDVVGDAPTARAPTGAVELEFFSALRHATLHWFVKDSRLRGQIEDDLERRLPEAATEQNPAATWLLGISGMLFGLVILGSFFVILLTLYRVR